MHCNCFYIELYSFGIVKGALLFRWVLQLFVLERDNGFYFRKQYAQEIQQQLNFKI